MVWGRGERGEGRGGCGELCEEYLFVIVDEPSSFFGNRNFYSLSQNRHVICDEANVRKPCTAISIHPCAR